MHFMPLSRDGQIHEVVKRLREKIEPDVSNERIDFKYKENVIIMAFFFVIILNRGKGFWFR